MKYRPESWFWKRVKRAYPDLLLSDQEELGNNFVTIKSGTAHQAQLAFESIFYRYKEPIKNFVEGLYPSLKEMSEDIIGDFFMKLWKVTPRYDPKKSLPNTYFLIVLKSVCLDFVRKNGRQKKGINRISLLGDGPVPEESPAFLPERSMQCEELTDLAMERCPSIVSQFEILQLYVSLNRQGKGPAGTTVKIATLFDKHPMTVKSTISRAKRELLGSLRELKDFSEVVADLDCNM